MKGHLVVLCMAFIFLPLNAGDVITTDVEARDTPGCKENGVVEGDRVIRRKEERTNNGEIQEISGKRNCDHTECDGGTKDEIRARVEFATVQRSFEENPRQKRKAGKSCIVVKELGKQGRRVTSIKSPEYPTKKRKEAISCGYMIRASKGQKLEVNCITFKLPRSKNCQLASVRYFLDSSHSHSKPVCGKSLPKLNTNDNTFRMYYATNTKKSKFQCIVKVTEKPKTKNSQPRQLKGMIQFRSLQTKCQCGIALKNRIVGGKEAKKGAYPWLAGLRDRTQGNIVCGATVISDSWLITAAHCTHYYSNVTGGIEVVLGEHDVTVEEGSEERRDIVEVIEHPEYKPESESNDICILKMGEPINRDTVMPICLPFKWTKYDLQYEVMQVAGWGLLKQDSMDQAVKLQFAQLIVVPRDQCRKVYLDMITNKTLCLYKDDVDACQGDSGGPAMWPKDGVMYIMGVTSWGNGCANKNFPGVYTIVSQYLDWIKNTTKAEFCRR